MSDDDLVLYPCDIVFTRGRGILSRLIRWASRSVGEAKTQVNHVGHIVAEGTIDTCMIAEALKKFVVRPLNVYRGTSHEVAIFRPLNITEDEKSRIVKETMGHKGESYGWTKLILHFIDSKILNGAYVFRRLGFIDKLPICSYRTARSFSYVGLHFGVKPREAQPDDIWDFCIKNTDKYECVRGLSVLDGPQ